ncbi:DNA fragmentation factor subunit beta [Armadillidium nasatum]|uniref:DNAation factor subunit beta n=1 Tax=Armadillidium nasatum TaxID=96803 RepID=A0A5N5TAZ0_9CRUS|nr:DNA fragmentation factor subunit beta [Armadillidium nasatum]
MLYIYHSHYFNRSENNPELRLCSATGLFHCFGDFQSPQCHSKHVINPYKSREERIIFSTWNFDHVIEKSRSIIPLVRKAIEENPNKLTVNTDYLFELLFEHLRRTESKLRGNLKLVNIVCHNKNPHNLGCDKRKLIYEEFSEPKELHRAKKIRL